MALLSFHSRGRAELKLGKLAILWVFSFLLVSVSNAQTLTDPSLRVNEVVGGLSQPTAMVFIGPGDLLILQKGDGRVRHVINGVLQAGEVLDVAVDTASERGLLGVALHPNFASNFFVYLYYTQSSSASDNGSAFDNRVVRYTWNGSKLINPTLIISLPVTPGPNHNGGAMTFGPDGKLYIVIGDLNRDGQLQNFPAGAGPDDTGVILRINDDGSIPMDNPFFSQGGQLARYFAYGVRNSFGLAFDPLTGELWDTENGPDRYDEINLVLPGFNSGWERIMGPVGRDAEGTGDLVQFPGSHYADPKFSWFNPVGLTAIVFMRSPLLGADYQNDVLVGDINNGNLYHFKVNSTRDGLDFTTMGLADRVADSSAELQEIILGIGFGGITDLKVGPDGLLYILSFGLGKVFVLSSDSATESAIFVRQQYLDFLDREPASVETSAWVNALNNGLPRSSLIEGFMGSEEFYFRGKFIARTYLGILTRDPDHAGFRAWLEVLLDGMSREQIVQFFLDSGEFKANFGSNLTNSQFVDRMYTNVLLRSADTGGLNAWVGVLNSGQMTRAQVALSFLDSVEFQSLSVSENRVDVSLLYFDMLRRDPDPGGFSGWVGALNSGVPRTSVIEGFLNSFEYEARV
jgi:aldose sugar dehydrogenase